MVDPVSHMRLGIAVLDTPRSALNALQALLDIGLCVDQLCLIAVERVAAACARMAGQIQDGSTSLNALFGYPQRWETDLEEDEIVATSDSLFNAFLKTQLTAAGSIVRSQASRQSWDVERAIRGGAIALVSQPRDTRQQQLVTRILLANSTHSVTTYELPALEGAAT